MKKPPICVEGFDHDVGRIASEQVAKPARNRSAFGDVLVSPVNARTWGQRRLHRNTVALSFSQQTSADSD